MEKRPNRTGKRTGEMGHHGIDSNDQVQMGKNSRGFKNIAVLADAADKARRRGRRGELLHRRPALQAKERGAWNAGERRQGLDRQEAARIPIAAGPYHTDLEMPVVAVDGHAFERGPAAGATFSTTRSGGGVLGAGAWEELQALAEALEAPVLMTENGRGALSDRHPLAFTMIAARGVSSGAAR